MIQSTVTRANVARVYEFKRAIWSAKCDSRESAQAAVDRMTSRLNAGDEQAAIECAMWIVENDRDLSKHVNRALGDFYFLHVDDLTVRDLDNRVIHTIGGCQVKEIHS